MKVLQRERDSQKCQASANISNLCVFPFWDEAAPTAKAGKVRWLLRGVKIDQNRIVLKSKMFFIYDYIIFYIVFVYTLDNDIHKIINFVGVSALWCVHDA